MRTSCTVSSRVAPLKPGATSSTSSGAANSPLATSAATISDSNPNTAEATSFASSSFFCDRSAA